MAQSVEHRALDFDSGHDPRILGLSPMLGSTLSRARCLLEILFFSPSALLPQSQALSLSKIKIKNKKFFKKTYKVQA